MIDRLRRFLDRPLDDADRPWLFALAVAVVAAAAAALTVLDDAGPAPRAAAQTQRDVAGIDAPAPTAAFQPAATPAPRAPSEEGDPPASGAASRAAVAASKRAARRFLAGYLPYAYGHGGAQTIAAAAPALRARLQRERPRVPARERRRRPRLELLQAAGVSPERAALVALVRDGRRRYSVPLQLAATRAGWLVTDLER